MNSTKIVKTEEFASVVNIMNPIKRLILGHMPFVGISYQSEKKDEEYRKRFSEINEIRNVIEAAIMMGVCKFAAATPHSSPLSPVHLQALQLTIDEGHKIELLPCIEIPLKLRNNKIDAYRRWATYAHFEEQLYPQVKQHMVNDPIMKFREDWKNRLITSRPYKEEDFRSLTIDWPKIDKDLQFFAKLPISHIEFGSESDFLAVTGRLDLLGKLLDRAKGHGYRRVLLGVHQAGMTIQIINDKLDGFHGYVTPLNPLGVMMFPTKLSVENSVKNVKKAVYAIKPLAGGRVSPKRAFNYVFNFDVEGCMIGVGSITELKEDLNVAIGVLEETNGKR